jgi:hypothetical protein
MAQLTFAIPSGELKLRVLIGHGRKAMIPLLAGGPPLPAPVWTEGVVDTGSNITCVTPGVLQRLGIVSIGQSGSHTVGGQTAVNLFEVSLSIPPATNVPGPMLTRRDLCVMEMPSVIPGVEVLVGMDILLDCRLLLDGPARQFTLEF